VTGAASGRHSGWGSPHVRPKRAQWSCCGIRGGGLAAAVAGAQEEPMLTSTACGRPSAHGPSSCRRQPRRRRRGALRQRPHLGQQCRRRGGGPSAFWTALGWKWGHSAVNRWRVLIGRGSRSLRPLIEKHGEGGHIVSDRSNRRADIGRQAILQRLQVRRGRVAEGLRIELAPRGIGELSVRVRLRPTQASTLGRNLPERCCRRVPGSRPPALRGQWRESRSLMGIDPA